MTDAAFRKLFTGMNLDSSFLFSSQETVFMILKKNKKQYEVWTLQLAAQPMTLNQSISDEFGLGEGVFLLFIHIVMFTWLCLMYICLQLPFLPTISLYEPQSVCDVIDV